MKSFLKSLASLAVLATLSSAASAQNRWLPYGPDGGDARSFATDPHDHNHIYLGTVSGTIYDSHDGGQTWKRLAVVGKRDDLVLDNILVDPANANHVLAAGWVLDREDGGLYVSNDAGKTWTPNEKLAGHSIRSLTVAPSDAKIMILGTLDGVYRSTDSGASWTLISPAGSKEIHEVESVAIDPKNPERMYAGTWHLPWRTTDGGQTWQNMKEGIIDDSDVFSIIVDPVNPSNVYLSACSGIYRSTDQGMKYAKVQGIPSTARRTRVLMEDPKEPGTVFAGTTEGLWKTSDSGRTFLRNGDPSWIINDVNIDPQDSKRVLLATDRNGVLLSNDGGKTFTPSNRGFSSRQISSIAQDRSNSQKVYVGIINDKTAGGVFASEDGGLSWTQKASGLSGADVFSLTQAPDGTMLAGTRHGIFRSTGDAWVSSGLTLALPNEPDPEAPAKPVVAKAPVKVAARGRVTGKASGKASAKAKAPAVSKMAPARTVPPQESNTGVYSMTSTDNTVFAGTEEGLLSSEDNGRTWNHVRSAPGTWRLVTAQGVRVAIGDLHKLALSVDKGLNFHEISAPSELTYITSVAVDDGGRIWVGGREGIWVSDNNGGAWHSQPNLFVPNVSGIYFDHSSSRVLVTSREPNTLVFSVHTPDMKVSYSDAGWSLRTVRPVGDHMVGVTPFDGVVLEPRMVVSQERPLK
ncbi:BNR/Asp-box repeat protein [Terriglobus roseus DSM 18391]|uniref:BNR/Asp-box repeat protein n=1 Tax=Terriglobus roseus (strain DSM 18391 / NRRL B-41598 / KBS 63) TaxID=926566 RepID=I3ZEZ0_TERRK|nr:hypothetical protein [Terriglobus roseus]AFL87808.1 BNR/Asp-box repeat protein [Terriglobus roseus DSM 18391]